MTFHCVLCDRTFNSHDSLLQHKRDSPVHAIRFDCEDCDRRFGSEGAMDQHLRDSPAHAAIFDCEDCEQSSASEETLDQHLPARPATFDCEDCNQSFSSDSALQQHLRNSTAHTPYDGISPDLVKRVYKTALLLRRTQASIQDIIRRSRTTLDISIVSSLWNAAERLNSLDEGSTDAQRRAERQRQRPQQAQQAEDAFIESFSRQRLAFVREQEQRQQAQLMGAPAPQTPDMRFTTSVMICGHPCNWIEFKTISGFLRIHLWLRVKKGITRDISPPLGYQKNYPNILGVGVFKAKEVLQNIPNT